MEGSMKNLACFLNMVMGTLQKSIGFWPLGWSSWQKYAELWDWAKSINCLCGWKTWNRSNNLPNSLNETVIWHMSKIVTIIVKSWLTTCLV